MAYKPIVMPRGSVNVIKNKNGTVKAQLIWNQGFAPRRNQTFSRIQEYVDSEVLRRCSPRVPLQTGMLEKSGKLGTVIGSGTVRYIAPYAAAQYYGTADSRPYDADRGAHWFERMKTAEKDDILSGANKIKGG